MFLCPLFHHFLPSVLFVLFLEFFVVVVRSWASRINLLIFLCFVSLFVCFLEEVFWSQLCLLCWIEDILKHCLFWSWHHFPFLKCGVWFLHLVLRSLFPLNIVSTELLFPLDFVFPLRGFPLMTGGPGLSIHSEEWSSKQWMQPSASVVIAVQSLHCVQLFATPRTSACQASLSLTISRSSPTFWISGWAYWRVVRWFHWGFPLPAPESVFLGLLILLQEDTPAFFFMGLVKASLLGADLGKGPGGRLRTRGGNIRARQSQTLLYFHLQKCPPFLTQLHPLHVEAPGAAGSQASGEPAAVVGPLPVGCPPHLQLLLLCSHRSSVLLSSSRMLFPPLTCCCLLCSCCLCSFPSFHLFFFLLFKFLYCHRATLWGRNSSKCLYCIQPAMINCKFVIEIMTVIL